MEATKRFLVTGGNTQLSNFYTEDFGEAESVRVQRARQDKTTHILYGTPGHYRRLDRFKVQRHGGTWYVIDAAYCERLETMVFLLESETYGDEAAHLIVDEDFLVILEDVWNGFDDLTEAFGLEAGWYRNET